MQISVIGTGYVGLVTGACFAEFGVSVVCMDNDEKRIARLENPNLPAAGVRYTRQVTQVWCAFFVLNGLVATWTAVWSSREIWALYNGFLSYIAMGLLFAGEWLMRRRLFPRVR